MARRYPEIIQVRFSLQDSQLLKKLAVKRGLPVGTMIRMAMVEMLQKSSSNGQETSTLSRRKTQ